jgi:hypothetical protein
VICEVPEDERLPDRVAQMEKLMIEGMQVVIPGAAVRVETSVRRSFSKADSAGIAPAETPPQTGAA